MLWKSAFVLSVGYIVTIVSIAVVILASRPKAPPTRRFAEIHESAVEVREILLPTAAAAALGFFVSLAASVVHENFSPKHITKLEVGTLNYLLVTLWCALLAFVILAILLEKVRVTARDVARHPASINRAAGLLIHGKEIDDLDAEDLRGNLEAWKRLRGKSAARVMLGRGASPRLNMLFQGHEMALRKENLPPRFSLKLFTAKFADFWWTGVILLVPLVLISSFTVFASLFSAEGWGFQFKIDETLLISLLLVIVQIFATFLFLWADAKHAVRVYRIDRIELRAAEKRVATLQRKVEVGKVSRRGLVRRLIDAVRNV